jgi:hypothetical protein
MSAIKDKIIDFLENGGRNLDYSDEILPKIDDMDAILKNHIPVWEYFGQTQAEWFGLGDKHE